METNMGLSATLQDVIKNNKFYDYDEALESSLDYFNGSEMEATTFLNKYALKTLDNEYIELNPDDMHRRLASQFARIEQKYPNPLTEDEIYSYLKNFEKLIPNGSIMAGLGNPFQIMTLSNCFVIGNEADSYGGILQIDQELVQLMKRRAGVGIDISHLRPSGEEVRNAARTSTGAASFMDRFSNSTREVAQGGRRGALMETIDIRHPDVFDFVNKKTDNESVTGANVSVKVVDEFMEALHNDQPFILRWPVEASVDEAEVTREIDPNELWDLIVENAHQFAEPGVLFWDRIRRESPADCYEQYGYKTLSTNPCIVGDTLIATADGRNAVPIEQLAFEGEDVPVYSTNPETGKVEIKMGRNPRKTGDEKEVWKLILDDGSELIATPDHKVLLRSGEYKELQNLETGDSIFPWNSFDSNNYRQISNSGASLKNSDWRRNRRQYRLIHEFYNGPVNAKKYAIHHKDFNSFNDAIENLEVMEHEEHRQLHADMMMGENNPYHQMSDEWKFNFASHPGEENPNYSGVSNEELREIGIGLASNLGRRFSRKEWREFAKERGLPQRFTDFRNCEEYNGVVEFGKWCAEKAGHGEFNDVDTRVIRCYQRLNKDGYVVKIENGECLIQGIDSNGDIVWVNHCKKNNINTIKDQDLEATYNHKVESVEFHGYQDVYNITVDDNHNYHVITSTEDDEFIDSSGICIRNCGEVPLCPYDSCRLLAMNLFGFVKEPFTDDAYFDWDEFKEAARVAQRLMDDVVDLELEAIDRIIEKIDSDPEADQIKRTERELWQKIRQKAKRGRRTGLGLTALGDTLAALGIRYGSEESLDVAEKIVQTQKLEAYRSSVEMAKQRGSFDVYSPDAEKNNPFIQRIADEDSDLYREMVANGRRNIAIMSIAPTGTVSMMAQTTSGVENLFKPYYFRSRKVNPNDENVQVDYVDDVGDAWQEFVVFHPRFKQWIETQGYDVEEMKEMSREGLEELARHSPYDGATVSDVDWANKVRMQGRIQKHIDHSISVTTNLPEDISVQRVKEVYDVAWEAGCKGQTVYREGSRTGVLNTESKTGSEDNGKITHTDAPKRPETLPCQIHQIRYDGDNWKILVGFLEDDPYEVFALKTGGDTGVHLRFVDSDNTRIEQGVIRKLGGGEYNLEAEDGKVVIEDIAQYAPDDEVRAMTRMISLSLRHGTRLDYITEQLEKAEGSIVSFSQSVLKAMRDYINFDSDEEACPECEQTGVLEYKEGCLSCSSCGWSRC